MNSNRWMALRLSPLMNPRLAAVLQLIRDKACEGISAADVARQLQGSRRLAESYRARNRAVKAAICLDMLGDKNLNITIPANTTPFLKDMALAAAKSIGASNKITVRDGIVVKDDHSAFLEIGYPAIDIIDFDFGSAPGLNDWWHTPNDTLDKISTASLLVSGRLTAEILNALQR